MTVRLVVAVTDSDWFEHLRRRPDLPEVNFWAPSANPFRALQPGELFLFKLHAPRNYIVGHRSDFPVGCRILSQPFFLQEENWLAVPDSWSRNIVSFKGYSTADPEGMQLWNAVQAAMSRLPSTGLVEASQARYGEPRLVQPRLGQGAFRLLVTDIYHRRCAITGEDPPAPPSAVRVSSMPAQGLSLCELVRTSAMYSPAR